MLRVNRLAPGRSARITLAALLWLITVSPRAPHAQSTNAAATRAQTKRIAASPRRWLAAPVHLRTIVGPTGDELMAPGNLTSTIGGGIAVFDFGAMEVRAFSIDGHQLWRTGRKGGGPGEFRNAMDVKVLPNGEFAVLDMGNRRITQLSTNGRLIRTIPLRFSTSRFVPLRDSALFGLTTEDSGALWSAVNRRGDVVHREAAPSPVNAQHSLTRELFTASLKNGSVLAFRWSDTFAILNPDGKLVTIVNGVETVPFPAIRSYPMKIGKFSGQVSRVAPNAVMGALSVAANEQHIFVLFAGATTNRGRIIDIYSATNGRYVGSELLSAPAQELVMLPNGNLATLRNDPIPSIDIWRSATPAAAWGKRQ